jgi:tetratricopeptide (TPR) repeat protein
LRIREGLPTVSPGNAQDRRDLARTHEKIGTLLQTTEQWSNGLEHLRTARTLYLDLAREDPTETNSQLELAVARTDLGWHISRGLGNDFHGALEEIRAALAIYEKLAANNPQDQRYRHGVWDTKEKIGYVLLMQGDRAGAIDANSKARPILEELLSENPLNADYRRDLVLSYKHGGEYRQESNNPRDAVEYFGKAAALDEELLASDPANALTRRDLGSTHFLMARLLKDLGDTSQALLHFTKAAQKYERVATDAPTDINSRFLLVSCRAGIAHMRARLGEIDSALEECRQAASLLQGITGARTRHTGRAQACEFLGHAYSALASSPKASRADGRLQMIAARQMFQQAKDILDDLRRGTGGTLGINEEWAKAIAGEIAECDAALAK